MNSLAHLQFHQRLWFAWVMPVIAFWISLYALTTNADPMGYQIIYSAALLVPAANAWALIPKFQTRIAAGLVGLTLPIVALVLLVWA